MCCCCFPDKEKELPGSGENPGHYPDPESGTHRISGKVPDFGSGAWQISGNYF
jgi:hypothetical protein